MKEDVWIGGCLLGQRSRGRQSRGEFRLGRLRLREIERVITARHGQFVPATDDADAYLRAAALSNSGQDVAAWCARWAPWADRLLIEAIEQEAAHRRHMLRADEVAKMLSVKLDERDRLGLSTIGACDVPRSERLSRAREKKREADRNRLATKRAAAGSSDREAYVTGSLSRTRPWELEGISRRTWERRRVASPSRVEAPLTGDGLATEESSTSSFAGGVVPSAPSARARSAGA